MTGSILPHVFNMATNAGDLSQDNEVRIQNLKRIKMRKENAHCGDIAVYPFIANPKCPLGSRI